MGSNNKEIPLDLLANIFGRLSLMDCLRCGAVCRSWAELRSNQFRPNIPNQFPWLMLAGVPHDEQDTVTFMDLSTQLEIHKRQIPDHDRPIRSRLWVGASDGWVVTVDEQSEMILLNPISKYQIQLPSVSTLSMLDAHRDDPHGKITAYHIKIEDFCQPPQSPLELREYLYMRVVLSSSPSSSAGKDCMALLIHEPGERLAFAKLGDKSWTTCPTSMEYYLFHDAIYHNGLFYTVRENGLVQAWDPKSYNGIFSEAAFSIPFPGACPNYRKYIAMSPWGTILQVWRLQDLVDDVQGVERYPSVEFRVYQLDKISQKWVQLCDLGEHALFVGGNRSMCISCEDVPGVRRNSIYFTQDFMETMRDPNHRLQKRDVGICNLGDGSIELLFSSDSAQLNWPSPVWIIPSHV